METKLMGMSGDRVSGDRYGGGNRDKNHEDGQGCGSFTDPHAALCLSGRDVRGL